MFLQEKKKSQLNIDMQEAIVLETMPSSFCFANLPTAVMEWIENYGFEMLTVCSHVGKIHYATPSVKKVLGIDSNDVINVNGLSLLTQKSRDLILNSMRDQKLEQKQFTLQIINATKRPIWVDLIVKPIYIRSDETVIYISLINNISDKKEAEDMLIRSEKLTNAGQLAAGVVHEIRNPLTSLKGFVDLLEAGIDREREYYKIIKDEIEKIESISSELLFISKPLTNNQTVCQIQPIVDEVISLMQTHAKQYDVEIIRSNSCEALLYLDRSQIKQVFINLVKNAIEAMQSEGTIDISIDQNENNCNVYIEDEGPGIPQHLLHKIKEPFFTTKEEGTGLGLMITNRIIENHNGEFKVESSESEGATCIVSLPLHDHE
ncbi:two-component system, sporulation sensor kinase A [Pelagirhabdus alkalitolerans]|uniref:histidine kinase n=1 Tax=Pelagirhabdus alkalitolerans TaxID=1612202 RepID=A0A1G6H687_9BACI|nr:ATP-binding protein [Pelagirhabdus alkalitolerans]SDB89741.1 two-component system, sporulation sensor kinase A [Pelagirhabdus alkalitolerans]